MNEAIPMFQPKVSAEAISAVVDTLANGWLSEGRQVKRFEEEFCKRFNLPRALALNSGTSGLHLAMLGAGVAPGDEVITTAQTFIASAMAVLYCGAKPVFADIGKSSPNIEPLDIEHRITDKTRAILVVHYGGYPCEMDAMRSIASKHKLKIIEDAAHALGATYRGRPIGTLGDFAVFSFQAIKHLTTGDGGMLVAASDKDHQLAYRRRWFGIDRANRTPSILGQPEWDIRDIGYKYHMNDIAAAIGLGQLGSIAESLARRRELNQYYRCQLRDVSGLELLRESTEATSACWLFTILVKERTRFVQAMRSRGIEAAVWHRRIDKHSLLGGLRPDLPNQEVFDTEQVSIPLRESLSDCEAERVVDAIAAGW